MEWLVSRARVLALVGVVGFHAQVWADAPNASVQNDSLIPDVESFLDTGHMNLGVSKNTQLRIRGDESAPVVEMRSETLRFMDRLPIEADQFAEVAEDAGSAVPNAVDSVVPVQQPQPVAIKSTALTQASPELAAPEIQYTPANAVAKGTVSKKAAGLTRATVAEPVGSARPKGFVFHEYLAKPAPQKPAHDGSGFHLGPLASDMNSAKNARNASVAAARKVKGMSTRFDRPETPVEPAATVDEDTAALGLHPSMPTPTTPHGDAYAETRVNGSLAPEVFAPEPALARATVAPEQNYGSTITRLDEIEEYSNLDVDPADLVVSAPVPVQDPVTAQEPAAVDIGANASEGWEPVDLRTVELKTDLAGTNVNDPTQATANDQALARKAVQMGFELVQRRANYSARARFVEALTIVARSLDEQTYSTTHVAALERGLKAYEEAEDFFPSATRPDRMVNLAAVLGGHETTLLEGVDPDRLSHRVCVREYMAFAEHELLTAVGSDPEASQALYGLGRLEAVDQTSTTESQRVRAHRVLMLYQTALKVNKQNYSAANELGVLLARAGQLEEAESALKHCISVSQEPTAYVNLASVYRRMGRMGEAANATQSAQVAKNRSAGPTYIASRPSVEWVDNGTFANMPTTNFNPQPSQPQRNESTMQRLPAVDEPAPTKPQGRSPSAASHKGSRKSNRNTRKGFWGFGK